jgi:hypothetical protein
MSTVLEDSVLEDLLSSSRSHGTYDKALHSFVDSGVKGVQISLTEGTFAGKKYQSVNTGFKSAIERTTATKKDGSPKGTPLPAGVEVAVIAKNDNVYLIRRDLVTVTAPAPQADPAPEQAEQVTQES